ncbi:MAG: nucleoside-diphosphate kinase [archaeon]|nr:nucleoside-diphosphate kinase [archaeon]MCP8320212.1 nucleoside-diphosphate kinase [archaeon]
MMKDQTLILIKPDAVKKGLIGTILSRFEDKGFEITKLKMMRLSKEDAKRFYDIHTGKPFFNDLVSFITSGQIVAAMIEGENACETIRRMIGPTNPKDAPKGTIRGDFAKSITENAIHASDSPESFLKEYKVIFGSNQD